MKLAIIYKKPMDDDDDCYRTALEVFLDHTHDHKTYDVVVAYDVASNRERFRREFGEPLYSAIAETDQYRDVDIWEIQSVKK